ncbi:HNH endonuclease [Shimia thalassica]|uniref:HNH endonuclease n=1 Tax=Shimia thalassica TaxID=1715693 RepID=UPI001C0A16BD|nr:HNH endonuclease [Shimia thalassica]MBU2941349.1 HNH endonuclease [Shimia thalassica]MDO6503166.1 HNH endonuclease [Shimia thalassica]
MIKLTRPAKPAFLTDEREAELLEKFQEDGSAVWKNAQITESLLQASQNKCAYCECGLQEVDSYMEVEHFKHKDKYEDEVVHWENLLPSCKRCNTKKGTHDVVEEPIVDPFLMVPADHLRLDMAYLRHKDNVGDATIEVLDLNSIDRLVLPRFMITTQMEKNLNSIRSALDLYLDNMTVRRRNKLIGTFKDTLKECQPDTKFSATAATFVHRNEQYIALCTAVQAEGLWDEELEQLHRASESIRLD